MPRIIHVLQAPRSRVNWIVRTDGVVDVVLKGREVACDYARLVAQRLADRLGRAVTLRLWNAFQRYTDEVYEPTPDPLRAHKTRRKAA